MKVLVTGADGFIGSHLVELLISNHYDVRAFCMYNSQGNCGWIDDLPSEIKKSIDIVLGDIRDPHSVREALKGCDIVFHLAALIAIPYSYIAPASYVETNINGTLNILQAARDMGISRVIHTSTSETYGTAQYVPINEEHPLVGQSPYAATKIGADQLAVSFYKSFETPVTILRPFNTFGPRQSTRAVIPTIITQIANGKDEISLGSVSPTRDFNFVFDTCNAFLEVSKSEKTLGKILNASSNFEVSIGETANTIAEIMNKRILIKTSEERLRPKDSEVNRLLGDNKMIKNLTNWKPEYSGLNGFKKGLEKTIKWFTKTSNLRKFKSDTYMI